MSVFNRLYFVSKSNLDKAGDLFAKSLAVQAKRQYKETSRRAAIGQPAAAEDLAAPRGPGPDNEKYG